MMLVVQNATKLYGKTEALSGLTLSLESNQTHVLLGSSGSGKSTLLRVILGLVTLDKGTVELDRVPVTQMSNQLRSVTIGYVPQDAGLFPHLTSEMNVTLAARTSGWSRSRISERLEALNELGILNRNLFERYPHQLSGGQKQRVALLRSIFLDPSLVLMDEPFASLDPLVRAEIQSEMKRLFQTLKKTVIVVTHDVGEADYLGDNIVLMHEGRALQAGTLRDLAERPATEFVSRFLNAQRIFQHSENTR